MFKVIRVYKGQIQLDDNSLVNARVQEIRWESGNVESRLWKENESRLGWSLTNVPFEYIVGALFHKGGA